MISSMDLFFSRDCADGAGPAVEAASPPCVALFPEVPLAAPRVVDAGCVVVFDDEAGASVPAGLLNRLGVVLAEVVAPEVAGAELPPPRLGNSDAPDDAVVVGAPLVAVVVAPVVAAVLAAGLPKLRPLPVEAPVVAPMPENMLPAPPAEEV